MISEKNSIENLFFFDSYAFFEIIKGNKNYEKYKNSSIITTKLNLFELYYGLIKEIDKNQANMVLSEYYKFVTDFNEEIIKSAAEMKLSLNKRNVSMTDCIGYELAKSLDIPFLTGDKEFEHLDNVEFVK